MKNLRYIVIGIIAGGAFGAKIGEYLSALQNASAASKWIESGFIYGSMIGMIGATVIIAAFALAKHNEETPQINATTSFS